MDNPRLLHRNFPYVFHNTLSLKKEGVAIQVKLIKIPYMILSIYFPNEHQLRFIRRVTVRAKQLLREGLVTCMGFNMVADKEFDRSRGCAKLSPELKHFIQEKDLHNLWCYQHPGECNFTFYSEPKKTHSHIDFFLLDRTALQNVSSSRIGVSTWYDHTPVQLTLRDTSGPPGLSPWRNNFFSKSPKIISTISRIFQLPLLQHYGVHIKPLFKAYWFK